MKQNLKWFACVALGLGFAIHLASADTGEGPSIERVEVLIGNVFVPDVGYEDKNTIEVTLDGYLLNSCYQIADTQVETSPDAASITIHQFADHRTDGVCAESSTIPVQMRDNVPYTLDVSIGHLSAGNYKILFNLGSTPERVSKFKVAPSITMAVDDYPYASVSAINIPDVVNGVHNVNATLVGTLANTCQFIKDVRVLPESEVNTIVVLPILGFKTGVMCAQIVLPFAYKVNVGKLSEGRYLLHVRSMNGKAVTRVFSSIRPDRSLQ
jgi:hypothetical protein